MHRRKVKLQPKSKQALFKRVANRIKHFCSFGAALLTVTGVTRESEAGSDSIHAKSQDSSYEMETSYFIMGDMCHSPISREERLEMERDDLADLKAYNFIRNIFNIDKESIQRNCKSKSENSDAQ